MSIYRHFGVRTIINAKGPSTRVSGGFPRPEVARCRPALRRYDGVVSRRQLVIAGRWNR